MNKAILIILVVVILGVGGYFLLKGSYQIPGPSQNNNQGTQSSGSLEEKVFIKNFTFSPAEITVKRGIKITWTNEDVVEHTVTSQNNFDSGLLAQNQSYSRTFDQTGTFEYRCTPHASMMGKIIVTD